MWLPGRRRDVFEVGVVMQHHGAVVLGHRRRQQVDDARRPVMAAGGHAELDVPRPLGDRLADRQDHVAGTATGGDLTYVSEVAAGVAGFEIDGDAGRRGPIHDEPGEDRAHDGMGHPGVYRRVDQVELARASWPGRQRHRRAWRMISGSVMSGPTPKAYGSSRSCSIRRCRLATNSRAALTVSFFVVVPSSFAAKARASSFKSIIVFISPRVYLGLYRQQYQVAGPSLRRAAAMASAVRGPMPGTAAISSGVAAASRLTEPKWVSSTLRRAAPSPGMLSSTETVIRLERFSRW